MMVEKMRAARLTAPGRLVSVKAPVPDLRDLSGHVLVRTELASICGSDLHIVHHGLSAHPLPAPPGYPGHESVGEVVESGDGSLAVGQRVLVVPPPTDARSFADHQRLPADQVIAVPDALTSEQALLAQQLGTVVFALKRFWPADGARSVTIIGAGSAGLMMIQAVLRLGAELIVVSEREPARRSRAAELGADVVVDPADRSAARATADATDGRGADLVIDAAGYDDARADAVEAVAVGGTIGCFGLPERPGAASLPFELLFRRRATLHTEHGAQEEPGRTSFRTALERIADGSVDVSGMLTHRFPLDRIDEALDLATARADGVIKVGLDAG
jgi:L-iditol 2-dehydrogenase